mmetsp:Transcript_20936/g.38214  ORF Transcript_20936/g.38214 Transcript_20936/m.38214 type:complete len:374 (+) Transcript_20936:81-1202(+)
MIMRQQSAASPAGVVPVAQPFVAPTVLGSNMASPPSLPASNLKVPAASSDGGTATFFASDGRRVTMISSPAQQTPSNQAFPDGSYAQPRDPRARQISSSPPIWIIDDFLSAEECARIVRENDHRVARSRLADKVAQNESRTSASTTLQLSDPLSQKVKKMVSDCIGIRTTQCEQPEMVRYQPGQQYKEHFDWLHGETAVDVLASSGQRAWTFLIYLVDVPEGGETRFASADPEPLHVKPKVGRVVIWRNMLPDGRVDPRTLHAGLPPKVGTKYVLNTWTHVGDVKQNLIDAEPLAQQQAAAARAPAPAPTPSGVNMSAPLIRAGPPSIVAPQPMVSPVATTSAGRLSVSAPTVAQGQLYGRQPYAPRQLGLVR